MSRRSSTETRAARLRDAESLGRVAGVLATGASSEAAVQSGAFVPAEETPGASGSESFINAVREGRVELLAPLEDTSLALGLRVDLMAAWTRGFLSGLGRAGDRLGKTGEDGREMLRDLEMMSHGADIDADPDAPAGVEEDQALTELVEYLRFAGEFFRRKLA